MDADILVIGSGAGGATLARALAESGLRILVLERGPYLRRERENWEPAEVFRGYRYHTDEQWRDTHGQYFHPVTGYHVGGNTKFYGAAVLRRRECDFGKRRHAGGDTVAWPIAYTDLTRYYDRAEQWYYAHGEAGVDPTEPPRNPYPYPPLEHEPRIQGVADALRTMGLHPFPLPLAIHRNDQQPADAPCIRCGTCDGFPCLLHAKGDAECCAMAPALVHPNVTLLTNTRVTRLVPNADGQGIASLEADHGSEHLRLSAHLYVLAAGAVNSAALLLRSASTRYPQGIANSSGLVGRYYMCHLNSACIAIDIRRKNPTVFQKTLGINDFYLDSGEHDFPYPLGHIQNLGKVTPAILHAERPYLPWSLCHWITGHSVDWWLSTEDLPDRENRVTVDSDGGIRLHYRVNNEAAHGRLVARWKTILRKLGFSLVLTQRMGIEAVAHQVGTLRFGEDPAQSVCDPGCRTHDLDNLYVADASFMPSISAVNPSLTIMANALRVADQIRERMAGGVAR